MKRQLIIAASIFAAATAAHAGEALLKYELVDGSVQEWRYDDVAKIATAPSGATYPYTLNEETRTLCITTGDGDVCVTFEEMVQPGESTGFSGDFSGTVTVVSYTE